MAPSVSNLHANGDVQQKTFLSNDGEINFRYTQTKKLKNALDKAAADFRSDVVTVPTESIMQVSRDRIRFISYMIIRHSSLQHRLL